MGKCARDRAARSMRPGWRSLVVLNLLLGVLVWVFHLTDYGLPGALSELLFPLLVGVVGVLALVTAARLRCRPARALLRASALLSVSGGGFYVIALPLALSGIVLLPWAFFRLAYAVEEMAAEVPIQQAVSADGRWLALVYFQPVGRNAGYNGHVSVRVAPSGFLLLERRLYYLPVTRLADGQPMEYVSWQDADTLHVVETNELLSVAPQRTRLPGFVAVPVGWLVQLRWSLDPSVGAPLTGLPVYPGSVQNGATSYNAQGSALQRWYAIRTEHPDRVVEWYRAALSEPPWSLVGSKLNRRENVADRPAWKRYCLEARRHDGAGERRTYYWEIMGFDQDRQTVWVNVSTPNPGNVVCQPYVNQLS